VSKIGGVVKTYMHQTNPNLDVLNQLVNILLVREIPHFHKSDLSSGGAVFHNKIDAVCSASYECCGILP